MVLQDDVPVHPYAVAMEVVHLAPKAAVSSYPWQEPKDLAAQPSAVALMAARVVASIASV